MTRDEWTVKILADFARVLATMDREPMSATQALGLAQSGAVWLLEETGEDKTLGEAMGLAALLITMVRETCIERDEKKVEAAKEAMPS